MKTYQALLREAEQALLLAEKAYQEEVCRLRDVGRDFRERPILLYDERRFAIERLSERLEAVREAYRQVQRLTALVAEEAQLQTLAEETAGQGEGHYWLEGGARCGASVCGSRGRR